MNQLSFRMLMERGIAAHQARRVAEALEFYKTALKLRPDDAETNSVYGLALVHLGRHEEAEPVLRSAVAAEPDQIGFRLNLAELLEATKRFSEAMHEIERVIAQSPEFARGWEKSGDLSVHLQKPAAAARAYARALKLSPENPDLALKLVRALILLRDFDGARMALEQARRAGAPDRASMPLYNAVYTMQRDWPNLERIAQAWTVAEPRNPDAWRALATADFRTGPPSRVRGRVQVGSGAFAEERAESFNLRASLPACPGIRRGRRSAGCGGSIGFHAAGNAGRQGNAAHLAGTV